jgi:hypothetical protein
MATRAPSLLNAVNDVVTLTPALVLVIPQNVNLVML